MDFNPIEVLKNKYLEELTRLQIESVKIFLEPFRSLEVSDARDAKLLKSILQNIDNDLSRKNFTDVNLVLINAAFKDAESIAIKFGKIKEIPRQKEFEELKEQIQDLKFDKIDEIKNTLEDLKKQNLEQNKVAIDNEAIAKNAESIIDAQDSINKIEKGVALRVKVENAETSLEKVKNSNKAFKEITEEMNKSNDLLDKIKIDFKKAEDKFDMTDQVDEVSLARNLTQYNQTLTKKKELEDENQQLLVEWAEGTQSQGKNINELNEALRQLGVDEYKINNTNSNLVMQLFAKNDNSDEIAKQLNEKLKILPTQQEFDSLQQNLVSLQQEKSGLEQSIRQKASKIESTIESTGKIVENIEKIIEDYKNNIREPIESFLGEFSIKINPNDVGLQNKLQEEFNNLESFRAKKFYLQDKNMVIVGIDELNSRIKNIDQICALNIQEKINKRGRQIDNPLIEKFNEIKELKGKLEKYPLDSLSFNKTWGLMKNVEEKISNFSFELESAISKRLDKEQRLVDKIHDPVKEKKKQDEFNTFEDKFSVNKKSNNFDKINNLVELHKELDDRSSQRAQNSWRNIFSKLNILSKIIEAFKSQKSEKSGLDIGGDSEANSNSKPESSFVVSSKVGAGLGDELGGPSA